MRDEQFLCSHFENPIIYCQNRAQNEMLVIILDIFQI